MVMAQLFATSQPVFIATMEASAEEKNRKSARALLGQIGYQGMGGN